MRQYLSDFARSRRLTAPAPKASPFEDFTGSWEQAKVAVQGYSAPDIVDRVLQASLAVRDGRAIHERDSVNFNRIEYAWPVLAGLLLSAALHGGSLRVVDVGGSLGTTYRQNRRFLSNLNKLSWAVVEQPSFVTIGREHFENSVLTFHDSIRDASTTRPLVALLSSSLQYLDDPLGTLKEVTATGVTELIIDRTPIHPGDEDRLTLQHVPPSIYPATYPARLMSRSRLLSALDQLGWSVVEEFETLERPMLTRAGFAFSWTGMTCIRSSQDTDAR